MNSEEIARLANVSRSTVSRVINNYSNVPPKTREKVQKIIDEYGYTPNVSARTLAGKANNIIGVFIADIDKSEKENKWVGINSPYNMELVADIIESCKKRNHLTLVDVISDLDECKNMEHYFTNRMIFGGIFVGFPYRTKELESLAKKQNNIVLIDQLTFADDKQKQFKIVNTDNIKGGYMATKYLIERGHNVIAHISGDNRLSSLEREKGYLKALAEAGIKKSSNLILKGDYREDVAYEKTLELLSNCKVSAIFVANDIMALGVVRAINEKGLKVPEDVSVIGFDNLEQAEWLNLKLTTVSVNLKELAEISVHKLFQCDKGQEHTSCNLKIIERMSVISKN